MHWVYSICFAGFLAFALGAEAAAQAVAQPMELQSSGRDYLGEIRLKGVQSNVTYFDPSGPAPELDTREAPPEPQVSGASPRQNNGIDGPLSVITFAILAIIVLVFLRYGGPSRLALRKGLANPARAKSGAKALHDDAVGMPALTAILQNPDKKHALIALYQVLIARAVDANGLLLQRSWTARDVLSRLPADTRYFADLKELVLLGEHVHFGDKNVTSEDFDRYVSRARPLLHDMGSEAGQ